MKTKNIIMTMAMGAALVSAPLAKANDISLELVSGGITSFGVLGTGPETGSVSYSGTVAGWNLTVATGSTTPLFGSLTSPVMDIAAVFVKNSGKSPLDIIFSGDDYAATSPAGAVATISGVGTGITGSFDTYYGGALGSETTLLTSEAFTSSTLNGSTAGVVLGETSPYVLTEDLQLCTGTGSLDDSLTVPDGGMTLMMLGSGLVALAGIRSKFGSKLS